MKAGKYTVKHNWKLPMILSDIFSAGLAVLIITSTINFITQYAQMLAMIGEENLAIVTQQDAAFTWRHYLSWIFPALTALVFAAYIFVFFKSHKLKKHPLTKLSAQPCRDIIVTTASLCKIPLLLGIFDAMYIFHDSANGGDESMFSIQFVLDALIIVILVRFCVHRLQSLSERCAPLPNDNALTHIKTTIKPQEKSAPEEDDT